MQHDVLVLIVVFGEKPTETPSFKTLAKAVNGSVRVRILFWDNSPKCQRDDLKGGDWLGRVAYVSTPENIGLSSIYNKVISDHLHEDEFLLVLDQDSLLPVDFFEKLSQSVIRHPDVDLYLPLIRANKSWVSPVLYLYGWGRYLSPPRVGVQSSKFKSAINSGMVISGRYLKGDFPGYDERLQFYGVDTQFMILYAERRKSFVVMDATITHDLSFFTAGVVDKAAKFRDMRRAYHWIYEKYPPSHRFCVSFIMLVVSIIYCVRYRSLAFLAGVVER